MLLLTLMLTLLICMMRMGNLLINLVRILIAVIMKAPITSTTPLPPATDNAHANDVDN